MTIEGYGTLPASKAQTLQKEDDNVNAVMDKIQLYTTELHRLLDIVDLSKKTKKTRAKSSYGNQKRQSTTNSTATGARTNFSSLA